MKYLAHAILLVAALIPAGALRAAGQTTSAPAQRTQTDEDLLRATAMLDAWRGDGRMLDEARQLLDKVLLKQPRNAPAHREYARLQMMSGYISGSRGTPESLRAAEKSLDEALRINPSYAEAYVFAGHLYFAQHRTADAKAALSKAERLGTDDPWLQNNWADILLAEGKLDEAAARYKKVVASQTKNSKAMGAAIEGLIEYHQKLGETDQVDRLYQLAISREPQSAWQYGNYAGFLLCTQDNYELAITNARKALSLMNYGIARQALAAALYRKWAAEALGGNGAMAAQTKVEAAQLSVGSPVSVVGEFCGTGPALEAVDKARFAPR